jgi:hypothetical protein
MPLPWMFELVARDDAVRDRALARHRALVAARHREQTIFGVFDAFWVWDADIATRSGCAPFVVLYLNWENRYPREWQARESNMSSPWTVKEVLLRRLDRGGVPEEIRPQVAELIMDALQRPYRCKDWLYAPLVQQVADARFLDRVAVLLESEDPLTRLRARFVRHIVEHPAERVTRTSWRRFTAT